MYKKIYREKALQLLNKLIDGHSLTYQETRNLVNYIYTKDTTGFLFTAFTAVIHAKGETSEELVGIIHATQELMPKVEASKGLSDTSGTGGGTFKTINVSTIAAFIVAALDYPILKASYKGVTSSVGSADLFANFGVNIFKLTPRKISTLLNTIGISPYYSIAISPKLKNRLSLSHRLFVKEGIKIKTPYHLSTNLCTPSPMKKRIYGVYSKNNVKKLAKVFRLLDYNHTLTFTAELGMPEISNVGKTHFVEQKGKTIKAYTLSPKELGVKERSRKDIVFVSKKQSLKDFIDILKGQSSEAKIDLISLNAGALLYLLEDLTSIREGVYKAKKAIYSGNAYTKFENLVQMTKPIS